MHGIMALVGAFVNARAVSLRQWAATPLTDGEFTALVVALSAGSRCGGVQAWGEACGPWGGVCGGV